MRMCECANVQREQKQNEFVFIAKKKRSSWVVDGSVEDVIALTEISKISKMLNQRIEYIDR